MPHMSITYHFIPHPLLPRTKITRGSSSSKPHARFAER
jgi:hypothetical protein